jgi:hypothetical protein
MSYDPLSEVSQPSEKIDMNWDYVAGYFDGEGSAGVYGPSMATYRVAFHNTHIESLKRIHSFLGCGRLLRRRPGVLGKKTPYVLAINKIADLRKVIPPLLERCIIKVPALKKVLAHIATKTPSKNRGVVSSVGVNQIKKWYCDERRSINSIAIEVGVSPATISGFLTRSGVSLRKRWHQHQSKLRGLGVAEITRLYCDAQLSTVAIGKRIGARHSAVFEFLKRNRVPIRNRKQANAIRRDRE